MSITKTLIALIVVLLIAGVGYLLFDMWQAGELRADITSFEECIAAGYPELDSFPPQCETPEGDIFIQEVNDADINSFAECVEAGYPVMESYPAQCRTSDGRNFTQDIGNEMDKTDLIRVSSPRPGATILSGATIRGEARGNWYFEATFPIAIYDQNGKELGRSYVTAEGEWMTTEFVPFTGTLEFNQPTTRTGNLVLEKANASGLPENSDQLIVPITFDTLVTDPNQGRVSGGCVITGCSSQICAEEDTITTCEYLEVYACYQTAKCGRDATGQCNWIASETLTQCLAGHE